MQPNSLLRALLAAGLCGSAALPALADAQSDRFQALEKRLESSALLIDQMSARIAELERGAGPPAAGAAARGAAPAAPAEQAQAIAALQDSVNQLTAGLGRKDTEAGVPLHGFADVGGAWSSGNDPTKLRGFNGGTLDLYLTPQFGQRVKGLVELAVEYGQDGAATVDLERLQLGYTVSDAVTLWAGRFHTPFGQWNTAFHHGANLQTSVFRPRFIDFEDKGGVMPTHSVGLWASGKTALGSGKLTYDGYVTNAHSIKDQTLDFGGFTDNGFGKMVGANLGYQPGGALAGLTVGVHAFGSTVKVYNGTGLAINSTNVRMAGAYFGYDENDWEVLGEYYHFANRDSTLGTRRASGLGFVQVGKTLGALTPFVRFEKASLNADDDFFRSQASGRSYQRTALGLRYELNPKASLKLELGSSTEKATTLLNANGAPLPFAAASYRRAALQYSVAF